MNAAEPHTEPKPCVEVLPERNGKRAALTWYPLSGDDMPQAGFAVITTDRDRTAYSVTEFTCGWPGRGFYLSKIGGEGTDKTQEGYSVFCSKHGPEADSCECAGFTRWCHCKHVDTVRALLSNDWI